MTKYEFLGDLYRLLSNMPADERDQAMKYYDDYFNDAGEDQEQAVIEELISPEHVAKEIKAASMDDPDSGYQYNGNSTNKPVPWKTTDNNDNNSQKNTQNEGFKRAGYYTHTTSSDRDKDGKQPMDNKKKNRLILLIVCCIILSPLIFGAVCGLFGALIGIASVIGGILITLIVGGGGTALGGVGCVIGGIFPLCTGDISSGVMTMGLGFGLFAIGGLSCYFGIWVCTKLFPALIHGVENLWTWLRDTCKKYL